MCEVAETTADTRFTEWAWCKQPSRLSSFNEKDLGILDEWHLLNPPRMPMLSYFLPGKRSRFREERIGFRSSLDRSGYDATGAVAHALFGD